MNYLQMFAKGGKTKGTDIIKGIQKILGVDDNQMAELWQVGINKYGSEEGIAQALNEATKGLTPQSSPDEVKAAVATVFSTGSEMFKCGGKLQKLAKRFAKGSSIDCGCGGIKVKSAQPGAKLISDDKSITILNPYTEQADTTGHYSYPSTNGRFRLSPEGRTADVWDNTGGFATRYADENWIKNNPWKQRLPAVLGGHRKLATQDYWDNLIQRVNNRFQNVPKPTETLIITENPEGKGTIAHIPMNQDGGEVTEAANGVRLTRRQARDLSKQNKGYSNSQYATAYYNALDALRRNSDLRGRDLRNQARIMASGINVGDNTQTITDTSVPQIAIAVAPAGQLNEVKTREQALNNLVNAVIRGDYGNGAQRREALGKNYDEVQSRVSQRMVSNKPVVKTEKKPITAVTEVVPAEGNVAEQIVNNPMLWNPDGGIVFVPISQRTNNKSITSQEAEAEWLKTHYPNGTKRNFITRMSQPYVVRNSVPEGSPLFIGPESPAHREARLRYESSIRHQKGGIVKQNN